MNALENYYQQQEEPTRSCLLAVRTIILKQDKDISASWKYGMPFYCFKGKMFCYLWVHKKYQQPYIGFVAGSLLKDSDLLSEKLARMKIFLIDPARDIPVKKIDKLLTILIDFYAKHTK